MQSFNPDFTTEIQTNFKQKVLCLLLFCVKKPLINSAVFRFEPFSHGNNSKHGIYKCENQRDCQLNAEPFVYGDYEVCDCTANADYKLKNCRK